MSNRLIILFDGVCNLCSGFVVFTIRRDPQAKFKFAPLQSEAGKDIQKEFNMNAKEITSIVLIDGNRHYVKSDAALRVLKELSGMWHLLYFLIIIPRPVRNFFYDVVAKNRYRWFGRKSQCMVPSPDLKSRFL